MGTGEFNTGGNLVMDYMYMYMQLLPEGWGMGQKCLQTLHAVENGDKYQPDGPLGSYTPPMPTHPDYPGVSRVQTESPALPYTASHQISQTKQS